MTLNFKVFNFEKYYLELFLIWLFDPLRRRHRSEQ